MRKIAVAVGVVTVFAIILALRAGESSAQLRHILDRAIQAHGGADNLKKFTASIVKSKGTFYGLGAPLEYTGENALKLPDCFRNEVTSTLGVRPVPFVQVVNGDKGWIKLDDKTEEMNKEMLAQARDQMNVIGIAHLLVLADKGYKLSALDAVEIGDRPAVGVRVERKGYRAVNLFFDKEKHYLLKLETRNKNPMSGEDFTSETLFDDYKTIDGVLVAHKITIKHDGNLYAEGETTEVTFAETLDDSLFEKP